MYMFDSFLILRGLYSAYLWLAESQRVIGVVDKTLLSSPTGKDCIIQIERRVFIEKESRYRQSSAHSGVYFNQRIVY